MFFSITLLFELDCIRIVCFEAKVKNVKVLNAISPLFDNILQKCK